MASKVWIRQGGSWVNVPDTGRIFLRRNGTWGLAKSLWIRDGGTWKAATYVPPVSEPTNLRITSAHSAYGTISVAWDAPDSGYGTLITGFRVTLQAKQANGTNIGSPVLVDVGPSVLSANLTVSNDTRYAISVASAYSGTFTGPSNTLYYMIGHPQVLGTGYNYDWVGAHTPVFPLTGGSGVSVGFATTNQVEAGGYAVDGDSASAWTSEGINGLGGSITGSHSVGGHALLQGLRYDLNGALTGSKWRINSVSVYWSIFGNTRPGADELQDFHIYGQQANGATVPGPFPPDNRDTGYGGLCSGSKWANGFNFGRFGAGYGISYSSGAIRGVTIGTSEFYVGTGYATRCVLIGMGPNAASETNTPQQWNYMTLSYATLDLTEWGISGTYTYEVTPQVLNSFWVPA